MNTEITKEEWEETNRKFSNIMQELRVEALKKFPLWMRMNWIANQMNKALLDKHDESEFKWDFINEICTQDLDPFDYNMYKPAHTLNEFIYQKGDIVFASEGIGPWHKHKCKDCGEEFYMTYNEVHFYKEKGLNLPKRCKECREKRKSNPAK